MIGDQEKRDISKKKKEDIKKKGERGEYPSLEKLLQNLESLPFSSSLKAKIRFYGGGLVNHNLFFSHLASQIVFSEEKEKQKQVSEDFLKALRDDGFQGLDELKTKLIDESLNNFIGNVRYEGSY